nr:uncharacterized protein LOC124212323 [Neodiprion pinetum]
MYILRDELDEGQGTVIICTGIPSMDSSFVCRLVSKLYNPPSPHLLRRHAVPSIHWKSTSPSVALAVPPDDEEHRCGYNLYNCWSVALLDIAPVRVIGCGVSHCSNNIDDAFNILMASAEILLL